MSPPSAWRVCFGPAREKIHLGRGLAQIDKLKLTREMQVRFDCFFTSIG